MEEQNAGIRVYTFQSLVNGLQLETFDNFKAEAYKQLQIIAEELEATLPSDENPALLREKANKIDAISSNCTLMWVLADAYLDLATARYRMTKEEAPKSTEDDRKVATDARCVEYRTLRNMCERLADRLKSKQIMATKNMALLEAEISSGISGKLRNDRSFA